MPIPMHLPCRQRALPFLLLLLILFPVASALGAGTLQVTVIGSDGKPLRDAVVAVLGPGPRQMVAAAPAPATAVMDQRHMRFTPNVLAVQRNSLVEFPNSDQVQHQVYSFSPAKPFELPLYEGTPPSPLAFDTAGPVILGCNIHDHMVGYVYVVDSPLFGLSGDDGQVVIALTPDVGADLELEVWHPAMAQSGAPYRQALTGTDTGGRMTVHLDVLSLSPQNPGNMRRTGSSVESRFRRFQNAD